MKLEKNTLHIELEKPLKILHITDSHLSFCDERDDARKQALAQRSGLLPSVKSDYLNEQMEYGENHCDLIVHTGDIMDFISKANVDYARHILKNDKLFYIAGNHDYSQYVGEAWEDMAYRMNSYMSMGENGLGVNMFFNSRIVGGINFVGIDNSYHQVEDWQTERLQMEAEKGFPIILLVHVPIFEQKLYEYSMECFGDSAYLMGCDEKHLMAYSEFRAMEQRPKAATKRFMDYLYHEPRVKAVLAGHLHLSFESVLENGIPQFVTDGGFENVCREISIV